MESIVAIVLVNVIYLGSILMQKHVQSEANEDIGNRAVCFLYQPPHNRYISLSVRRLGDGMGLSLRIDVDNPFGYASFFRKVLNRISLDYNLIPKWSSLGYLDHAIELRDYLDNNSIPATWFFRNITKPNRKEFSGFRKKPFDLAIHAERTDTLQNFTEEVRKWKENFGSSPKGFSKHGSGDLKLSRMHVKEYDAEDFIDYGKELKFEFFSGNGVKYESGFESRDGLTYISSIFWLDNLEIHPGGISLEDVIAISESVPVIVLVHPYWWSIKSVVRGRLDYLVQETKFVSIQKQVEDFRRADSRP